jgi:pyruvate/2-oxoglutarate dehydrogenase complex dihydrolipoamide dehydrogenase (E3) component
MTRSGNEDANPDMTDRAHYDVCVIGGGSGGLGVAIGAALLGVSVALVEPRRPGTDGAEELARATLLGAAARIQAARHAPGLDLTPPIDLVAIQHHVAAVVAAASATNGAERLRALGIHLIEGRARFLAPDRIATDGNPSVVTARRFVIAIAGSSSIPAIPGLDRIPPLTPADLTTLDRLPAHLAILGGQAEAVEWAQAYRRLGCAVTLIAAGDLLDGQDPELVDLLQLRLRAEGVRVLTRTPIDRIARNSAGIELSIGPETIAASDLLVAAGRRAEFDGLDLSAAGVTCGPDGILVDRQLRTANRRIHALGDAIGSIGGVQDAAAQAGVVLRNILFRQNARFDPMAMPRVVRTDPGLAQIGPAERQARSVAGVVTILRCPLHDNDRARAEGVSHGLVKVVTDRKGRILGAGILAPNADELVQLWQLAIAQRLKIGAIAGLATAYPTLGEASKRAAGSFLAPRLLSARTKRLVRWLARLG